nr:amidase family protein [Streptomyces sp. SID1328]
MRALANGETTSHTLTAAYLERIAADTEHNAIITTDPDRALAAAATADAQRASGDTRPLLGLPVTVKDSLETSDLRTTSGALADHFPTADADVVARLKRAGAVLIGKSNCPPMCQDLQTSNTLFGTTPNPHDNRRTAGGSSGGSAAAVAAGLTPLDIGSDLAGSLRLPAHYCGVYGLRPTQGLIPTRGHIPRPPGWLTSSDMLTVGPLARTAGDLDLALRVLAGPTPEASTAWRLELPPAVHTHLGALRIGIWADDPACAVDTDTRTLMQRLISALQGAGAQIEEHTRPADFDASNHMFQQLMYATSTAAADSEKFAQEVESAATIGEDHPAALYLRSRAMRHREWLELNEARAHLRNRWLEYFQHVDVLITPAAPTAAVLDQTHKSPLDRCITVDGQRRNFFDQTAWLNLIGAVGLPAAVAPVGRDRGGLPLSVQVVGPALSDRTVIAVAGQLNTLMSASY